MARTRRRRVQLANRSALREAKAGRTAAAGYGGRLHLEVRRRRGRRYLSTAGLALNTWYRVEVLSTPDGTPLRATATPLP